MLRDARVLKNYLPDRHVFAFYLGIPLGIAYLFGLNYVGLAKHLSLGSSLTYWLSVVIPFWWLLEITSRGTAWMTRPLKSPLWLILAIGSLLAVIIFTPYVQWHASWYLDRLPGNGSYRAPTSIWYVLGDWRRLLSFSGVPLIWISVNYYYDRVIDVPRFRGPLLILTGAKQDSSGDPDSDDGEDAQACGLLDAIPSRLGRDVLALQAEGHYVRVFTERGSGLVRYTFRRAIEDLSHLEGLQVHRSYWVATSAVENVLRDGQKRTLVIANDIRIPVSRTYVEAARLMGIPID